MTPPTPPPLRDRAFPNRDRRARRGLCLAARAVAQTPGRRVRRGDHRRVRGSERRRRRASAQREHAHPVRHPERPTPRAPPRRPTATSAPSDFVEDGRFDEWRLQDPLREADGVSLYLSTSAAGLVLAVKSAAPKAIATTGACSITMTLATAPPTLPSLGVDKLVFSPVPRARRLLQPPHADAGQRRGGPSGTRRGRVERAGEDHRGVHPRRHGPVPRRER